MKKLNADKKLWLIVWFKIKHSSHIQKYEYNRKENLFLNGKWASWLSHWHCESIYFSFKKGLSNGRNPIIHNNGRDIFNPSLTR